MSLLEIGEHIVSSATKLGATEVNAIVSESASTELSQRAGRLESCQESRSLGVDIGLLVEGRYSTHSTSDLRPAALTHFIEGAVQATRYLEVDEHRGLPDRKEMGEAEGVDIDPEDPTWADENPEGRRDHVEALEAATRAAGEDGPAPMRSATAYVWDARTTSAKITSNGFASQRSTTSFGHGATVSLEDAEGRIPEAYAFFSARHKQDLPGTGLITELSHARARERLGSGPAASGRSTLVLANHAGSGLLRVLLGPMTGTSIYEKRSCLAEKLGKSIGSSAFTMLDDPHIHRGLSSRLHDGDGRPSQPRTLVKDGVLQCFLVGVYNGRRLGVPPSTGSTSNLVVPPGQRSVTEILEDSPRAIVVKGFLGGNTNPTTGDFSFGIHGTLFERGESVQAVSEMNISGNLFDLFERYTEAANDPWLWGSCRTPSMVFDGIQFSGM